MTNMSDITTYDDKDTIVVNGQKLGKFKATSYRALANRLTDEPNLKKELLENAKTTWDVLQNGVKIGVVSSYNISREITAIFL